jgi:CubicO group peptidase (beta-lactamase class C family)
MELSRSGRKARWITAGHVAIALGARHAGMVVVPALFVVAAVRGAEPGPAPIVDPPWLRTELEATCREKRIPAIAVAVVIDGKVVAATAVGHRKVGAPVRVERDDAFQVCSVAKSMTATLLGRLVDEQKLRWDLTLAEMFPGLVREMRPVYQKVTVAELLSHTDGLPYEPTTPESVTDARAGNPTGRRFEYVRAALRDKPEALPGTKFIYGGGPILVASYVERIQQHPYEAMMHRQVFGPLGMTTAGFGCTATPGQVDGPWEHSLDSGAIHPVAPTPAMKHQARSPVGRNVHCSVIDLARFTAIHLRGARGRGHFLRPETYLKLYEPQPPTDNAGLGFFRNQQKGIEGDILTHNGGNGTSCSVFMIAPDENVTACVLMNLGSPEACKTRDEWCKRLLHLAKRGEFGPVPKE